MSTTCQEERGSKGQDPGSTLPPDPLLQALWMLSCSHPRKGPHYPPEMPDFATVAKPLAPTAPATATQCGPAELRRERQAVCESRHLQPPKPLQHRDRNDTVHVEGLGNPSCWGQTSHRNQSPEQRAITARSPPLPNPPGLAVRARPRVELRNQSEASCLGVLRIPVRDSGTATSLRPEAGPEGGGRWLPGISHPALPGLGGPRGLGAGGREDAPVLQGTALPDTGWPRRGSWA